MPPWHPPPERYSEMPPGQWAESTVSPVGTPSASGHPKQPECQMEVTMYWGGGIVGLILLILLILLLTGNL